MTQTINIQNSQQKSFMSSMIKIIQATVKEIKMMKALNLKRKSLNEVFAIIQVDIC